MLNCLYPAKMEKLDEIEYKPLNLPFLVLTLEKLDKMRYVTTP